MSEHVEARSLAALNQLAANPPQYPTKPNEARQAPLTLYISRVPGTRGTSTGLENDYVRTWLIL